MTTNKTYYVIATSKEEALSYIIQPNYSTNWYMYIYDQYDSALAILNKWFIYYNEGLAIFEVNLHATATPYRSI